MKRSLILCISFLVTGGGVVPAASFNFDQDTMTRPRRVQGPTGSFLGVELSEVTGEAVQRLKLREERGALIDAVTGGSSAAQAGLQKNDVIVKWDGEPIESARELSRHIRETPAGRAVRLGVMREGREIELSVKLGERRAFLSSQGMYRSTPAASAAIRAEAARGRAEALQATREATARAREQAREATSRAREQAREATTRAREQAKEATARARIRMRMPIGLGVELQSMTPQLAEYFGLSKRSGALIVFVFADSPAAKAGLKAGDVILSAGGETVENPMDLRRVLTDKSEGTVEFKIVRDKQEKTLTVKLEKGNRSWLLEPVDVSDVAVHTEIGPMAIELPKIRIAPRVVNIPKIALAPMAIQMPKINITPAAIPMPKINLAPMKIEIPQINMAPMVVAVPKINLVPMNVEIPKINIAPIKVLIVPRRVIL